MATTTFHPHQEKIAALSQKLLQSANATLAFLQNSLNKDGSYTHANDIACYYKSPMFFIRARKPEIAKQILDYIEKRFLQTNGDFLTSTELKSEQAPYRDFWTYTNGWILRAANLVSYDDILKKGLPYFHQYALHGNNGFLTNASSSDNQITDVLTAAHHGLIYLEMGDHEKAYAAGNYLCDMFNKQTALDVGFYTRDKAGKLITHYHANERPFYFISKIEPEQLYFLLGYPAAYLAILYNQTKEKKFVAAANDYLEFTLSCHTNVYACNFSHKLAWAASCLYRITQNEIYLTVIERICQHFITMQQNGMWYLDNMDVAYDQSPEIALWFLEIVSNLQAKEIHAAE